MGKDSLACGRVIKFLKHGYLIRIADGSTQLVSTDSDTLGNGPAHFGEEVQCHVTGTGRASLLTRVLFFPCNVPASPFASASVS